MTLKQLLALAAFIAALVFFLIAALGGTLGDVNLIAAGLTSLAAGFVLERLPAPAP